MENVDSTSKPQPSYTKTPAELYDELYAWKNYEQESARLIEIIGRFKQTDGCRLLDVACGTGSHLVYLTDNFEITGLDKSEEQLAAAREKLPSAEFSCGDMLDFRLERDYDVVTCLFRSIGYAVQLADMRRAIKNMANHLRPGGLLIFEPFLTQEQYEPGRPHAVFIDKPELKISRIHTSKIENGRAVWEMHHLVGQSAGVDYFVESHEMGLYTNGEYLQAVKDAGLKLKPAAGTLFEKCDLLIAVKPL